MVSPPPHKKEIFIFIVFDSFLTKFVPSLKGFLQKNPWHSTKIIASKILL